MAVAAALGSQPPPRVYAPPVEVVRRGPSDTSRPNARENRTPLPVTPLHRVREGGVPHRTPPLDSAYTAPPLAARLLATGTGDMLTHCSESAASHIRRVPTTAASHVAWSTTLTIASPPPMSGTCLCGASARYRGAKG